MRHPGGGEPGALLTIERVAILQRVELFTQVPGHLLVAVAKLLEEVPVEAGGTVIERGAIEDWLFVVVEGRLRVHLGDRTLQHVGRGEVVGELAALASAPRSASVTAEEPSLLLRLRRAPLEELLDERPEIARGVIATLVGLLQASHESSAGVER